jgi:hypothetical protein
MGEIRRWQVVGGCPVVIDGVEYAPGAVVETATDVTFLVQIGALAPAPAEAPGQDGEAD